MKKLVVLFFALASLGFVVDTPQSIRERNREERSWRREAKRCVNLRSLHAFIIREINSRGRVEDVDVTASRVEKKWVAAGTAFRCGDWIFSMPEPKTRQFVLWWTYDLSTAADGTLVQRSIAIRCMCESRSAFKVLEVKKHEDEVVILME